MSNTCTTSSLHRSRGGCNTYGTARRKFRNLHEIVAARTCSTLCPMEVWTRKFGTDLHERRLRKSTSLSEPQGSMLAPPTQVCVQQKLQRFLAMLFSAECFQYRSARFCCITYLQNSTSVELCRNVQMQIPAVPNMMNYRDRLKQNPKQNPIVFRMTGKVDFEAT